MVPSLTSTGWQNTGYRISRLKVSNVKMSSSTSITSTFLGVLITFVLTLDFSPCC